MPDRWLVLGHEATNSGAPRMLLEVLRGVQAARGPDWSCEILLDRGGPLTEAFAAVGPVRRLTAPWAEGANYAARSLRAFVDRPWIKPWSLRRAVQAWQAGGPGLIFNNTATNGRLLAALPDDVGPVITLVHELAYSLRRFNRPVDLAATLARTDLFLAVSSAVALDLESCGVDRNRIRVLPNFLSKLPPVPDFNAAHAQLAARLNLPADTRIVTGCGHLDPVKGTDVFADMIGHLAQVATGPVAGVWIGDDIDRDFATKVRAQASARLRFVGAVTDPLPWFAGSDVITVPSRAESFGRVALEAAALGRPVLAFAAARGPAELLPPDALVHDTSAAALAAAIAELLAEPERAQRLGATLRQRVANGFLADTCIPRLLAVIAEVSRA